jgi:putative transposase
MLMKHQRKSHTELSNIYFWTATIHKWKHLLFDDYNKQLIIDYLNKLSSDGFVTVYAFVIMPNHIHLIWQQNKKNGKESPFGSFLKFTAHQLLKILKEKGAAGEFAVQAANKSHEIWQRDSLAVEIYSRKVAEQKLNYIHANPIKGVWKLAESEIGYFYSSARFYETGIDDFGFLKNLFIELD